MKTQQQRKKAGDVKLFSRLSKQYPKGNLSFQSRGRLKIYNRLINLDWGKKKKPRHQLTNQFINPTETIHYKT
jgi:hypothetical protein